MESIKMGEIYYADLSSNNDTSSGLRPVLILQNDIANKYSPTTIAALITSRLDKAKLPTHIDVSINEKNAVIILEQPRTLDKKRLKEKIKVLSADERDKLNNALRVLFSISDESNQSEDSINPYQMVTRSEWKEISSLREKIDELRDDINSKVSIVIEKQKISKGKLGEFSVVDYFKSLGYKAERAGIELDHLKIDVVAVDDTSMIFTQVKMGQVSNKEIVKLVKSVSSLQDLYIIEHHEKVVCMCADDFPADSESMRRRLEKEFEISIMFIHKYQILKKCPEYKSTIN